MQLTELQLHALINQPAPLKLADYDLSDAVLMEENLSKANLAGANLSGTNLLGADLSRAVLSGANLKEAGLDDANLFKADLSEADLSGASLDGADLREANLCGTDLRSASLKDARMNGAIYSPGTKWSAGFDPEQTGAVIVQDLLNGITAAALDKASDEEFAKMLFLLERRLSRDYRQSEITWRINSDLIKEIGQRLYRSGGEERMKKVLLLAGALGRKEKEIEQLWNQIGTWKVY